MEIGIIVAMTRNRVIGKDGKIPWKIKEDILLFKGLTMNRTVIMGRKTWFSLLSVFRPLPNRNNIIISNTLEPQSGAFVCKSIDEAVAIARRFECDAYCIGGAQLYSQMLPISSILHISLVKGAYEGDTYFPEINYEEWELQETVEFEEFTYKRYKRKTPNNINI
ncbi:MAG: dihydrofolate reductase [Candidatus Micrarchaeia archaeon]